MLPITPELVDSIASHRRQQANRFRRARMFGANKRRLEKARLRWALEHGAPAPAER